MENTYYGCEKTYIEQIRRITQQNMLIEIYCAGNFSLVNLVDFYYRSISENAILMFLIICAIYPVLFMMVAFIADKYLSVGMQDLSQKFNLSPTLAAVTLIAFANGAPDVLSSLSAAGKDGGALISLGSLYGGFIFSSTLVISNVVWNTTGPVKLPKLAVLKELGFYFISVFIVIGFGFIQSTGYPFIGCYLTLYTLYIIVTIIIEKFGPADEEKELEADLEEEGRAGDTGNSDVNKFSMTQSKPYETHIEIEERDTHMGKSKDQKNTLELAIDEMIDDEAGLIVNILIMPLATCGMLTVSYLENPFMKTYTRYLILSFAITWVIKALELSEARLLSLFAVGLGFGIVLMFLEIFGLNNNVMEIIYEFISVFAAIGWIKLISGLIIDFITFLAFYFDVNEVILSSILLSAGNTIGDFFGNGALSKAGSPVMAGIASYSGQIFNNFIGFSVNIVGSISTNIEFDIFALGTEKDPVEEGTVMPIDSKFIIIVIACVLLLLILNIIYMFNTNFTLGKGYTYVLVIFYACFFCGSLAFGLISE